MSLKTGWLKLSGTVDYFWSGFKQEPVLTTMLSGVFGGLVGAALTGMVYVTKDAGVKSFHDDADRDVELYEGGSLMAFPDNCDLGSDFYLISKKKGGGLEFGRGGHDYTQVLPIETQDEIADDISDCMDDMADWVNEGRLNFAEEFRYQAGLSYSEAGIIFDGRTDKIKLYKDILEEDRDKPPHLKAAVESMDSYVEDGDNSTLYQAEFAKAQKDWARYKYDRQYEDPDLATVNRTIF
jgi:hypothetical protein